MSEKIYEILQKTVTELAEKLEHPGLDIETRKIKQKLREARYNPADINIYADCILAVLLITESQGYSVKKTFEHLLTLAEDIKSRNWKKMPDETYQVI
jgi:hypothetical protein